MSDLNTVKTKLTGLGMGRQGIEISAEEARQASSALTRLGTLEGRIAYLITTKKTRRDLFKENIRLMTEERNPDLLLIAQFQGWVLRLEQDIEDLETVRA